MAHWFASLTWSQAAMVAIAAIWLTIMGVLALCALSAALGLHDRPLAPRRNRRVPQRRRGEPDAENREPPWPIADYADRCAEKCVWLGDRHLLARPVRRLRPSARESVEQSSIGQVIQFDRGRK